LVTRNDDAIAVITRKNLWGMMEFYICFAKKGVSSIVDGLDKRFVVIGGLDTILFFRSLVSGEMSFCIFDHHQ
jgi:hypothetical protein